MKCPSCQHPDSRVVDSRDAADAIRRRRSCLLCGHRFTTLERVEQRLPWVVKRDGRREPFQRDKVLHGIALACRKRPIDAEQILGAVTRVEQALMDAREPEVPTTRIGALVMDVLEEMDDVAWVRFVSVYQAFESVEQFSRIVEKRR